jgi:hypothetical protein
MANGTASDENVMYLFGDDFAYMNAYSTYHQLEKLIEIGNKYNK